MSVRTRAVARASLAFILVAELGVGTAIAQRAEQRAWCAGQFGVALRQRIDACTAVIDSGRLEGKSLSSALSDRGVAYLNVRNNDRALADFNEAIRVDPDDAKAFSRRGLAYQLRGQDGDIVDAAPPPLLRRFLSRPLRTGEGSTDEAQKLLKSAADNCPAAAPEAGFAKSELGRIRS